jgi:ribosomal protein S18 acetylase RimI-like enzyme
MHDAALLPGDDPFAQPVGVDAFNASFRSEVYGDAPMSAERFVQHVERHTIDLTRSPRWTVDGALSGIALLGFRERRAWLGGFGVVPEFRGRGLADSYLEAVRRICRDAGAQTIELEVLVHNPAAIALYKRCGFRIIDELVGWARAPLGGASAPTVPCARNEHEIARIARAPATCWQREPQSVAAAAPCERVIIGDEAAPRAYAFLRRKADSAAIVDAGARDAASAELLLGALDAVAPEVALVIINEPAHGPLHEEFTARASWSETVRQHRMRRSTSD